MRVTASSLAFLLVAAAILLVSAGSMSAAGYPPVPETDRIRYRIVYYPAAQAIRGSGVGTKGEIVELEEDRYPFRGFRRVSSQRLRGGGRYRFTVRPQQNTKYRVRVGSRYGTSLLLHVVPTTSFTCIDCRARTPLVHFRYKFRYPPQAPYPGRAVYLYFGVGSLTGPPPQLRLAGVVGRLRRTRPGESDGSFTIRRTERGGRLGVAFCVRDPAGYGYLTKHNCGVLRVLPIDRITYLG